MITGAEPDAEQIEAAVAQAADHDQVVLVTSAAWRDPRQAELAAAIGRACARLIVVAARDPYELAVLPDTATLITGYAATAVTLDALAEVLLGRQPAPGRLPVDLHATAP